MFDYKKRLSQLRLGLSKISVDAFLITSETNVTYLSGFKGDDSLLLITPEQQFFLTDSRYTEEARDTVKGFTVVEVKSSTYETIGNIVKKAGLKKLGFESMNLPFEVAKQLEGYIGKAKTAPLHSLVEKLRSIKDKEEIWLIEKSVAVTKKVLAEIVPEIKPDITERDLSCMIECEFIQSGAEASFKSIVASGKNSSKPHARPTNVKIGRDNFVMIDMGCKLDCYNSDITRMVLTGAIKDKFKEIYQIVKAAQDKAIEVIKAGRKISEVDKAGRGYIEKKGFSSFFSHSLGHGVGMDVHEEPSISGRSSETLKSGMVFTVEPAIYIPKFGGVRIEDMVLVTETGCRILTR